MCAAPAEILGEVFGYVPASFTPPFDLEPAPACPFREEVYQAFHKPGGRNPWKRQCDKKTPSCSVYKGPIGPTVLGQAFGEDPIATCPARFLQDNVISDIAKIAWEKPGQPNFSVASEVSLGGKWQVDLALYESDPTSGDVTDFCSVEIQAIDITNSISQHIKAFSTNQPLPGNVKDPGFNWANATIKRLFTQLLFKGYMHHVWGKKIAVVIQDRALDYIERTVTLATVPSMDKADICILPYKYTFDPAHPNQYRLQLAENRVLRIPYGSFALSTLSIELPDLVAHQNNFVAKTL